MANVQRRAGIDTTYAREHRARLPQLYGRTGHRMNTADRDWSEFCFYCRRPILLVEEVRDVGQNLTDKGVTLTRTIAERAGVQAVMLAWHASRPAQVQTELDRLHMQIEGIQATYPIDGFQVRDIHPPRHPGFVAYTAEDWWRWLGDFHQQHWSACAKAAPGVHMSVDGQLGMLP